MTDADEIPQGLIIKAIDRLVREGRAEHVLIGGKLGVRLIKPKETDPAKPVEAA